MKEKRVLMSISSEIRTHSLKLNSMFDTWELNRIQSQCMCRACLIMMAFVLDLSYNGNTYRVNEPDFILFIWPAVSTSSFKVLDIA